MTLQRSFSSASDLLLSSVLLVVVVVVQAIAPPHPDYPHNVHQVRPINTSWSFEPQHLTREHCRFWTEEECRFHDEELAKKAGDQSRRRKLNPSIGTFKVLVLLVYFPEHADRVSDGTLPTRAYFDELYNAAGTSDINPVGSIRNWLRYNSNNQYIVEFDVQDWQPAKESEAFYAGGVGGRRTALEMSGIGAPVLDDMDDAGFDFAPYDADGDEKLDHIMFVTSSLPAEIGLVCDNFAPNWQDRIWSQGVAVSNGAWINNAGTMSLNGFTISGSFTAPCGVFTHMAVPTHEYLHGFNLVDLYDFDFDEGTTGIGGVGSFDMMCNTYGWNNNGQIMGHAGPYTRMAAGWVTATEITQNGLYGVQPSEFSGQVYMISQGFPNQEYLLIENRWGVLWDGDWTCRGIVIWHVDDAAPLQSTRGYPGHPNWPKDHYRVAVLQADGNYDIEKLVNLGDEGDCWGKDSTLGPDTGTWPNTAAYQGGTLTSTGISINIQSGPGFVIQIEVSGL